MELQIQIGVVVFLSTPLFVFVHINIICHFKNLDITVFCFLEI